MDICILYTAVVEVYLIDMLGGLFEDWLSIKDEMMAKAVVTNFKESIDKKSIFNTEFKISPPLSFASNWRRLD